MVTTSTAHIQPTFISPTHGAGFEQELDDLGVPIGSRHVECCEGAAYREDDMISKTIEEDYISMRWLQAAPSCESGPHAPPMPATRLACAAAIARGVNVRTALQGARHVLVVTVPRPIQQQLVELLLVGHACVRMEKLACRLESAPRADRAIVPPPNLATLG